MEEQKPKSWRITLQECLEDDNTKRGSGSRLALILPVFTFCVCLVAVVYAHAFCDKDTITVVQVITGALTLGGGAPYTLKQLFGKGTNAQGEQSTGTTDQGGGGQS